MASAGVSMDLVTSCNCWSYFWSQLVEITLWPKTVPGITTEEREAAKLIPTKTERKVAHLLCIGGFVEKFLTIIQC